MSQLFRPQRYSVECDGATDAKQLVGAIALVLESTGEKLVIRQFTGLAGRGDEYGGKGDGEGGGGGEGEGEESRLLVLDTLDHAWKPHENQSVVEDFLSLLADLQHITLIVNSPFLSFCIHRY